MRSKIWSTSGQRDVWGVPNDCSVIWISGCGGGGGGGASTTATGAAGGAAAPCFLRFPLSVTPRGGIAIQVGNGGTGAVAGGAAAETYNGGDYLRDTRLAGRAIVSAFCDSYMTYFSLGYGAQNGGNASLSVPTQDVSAFPSAFTMTDNNAGIPMWWFNSGSNNRTDMPVMGFAPACQSDFVSAAGPTNTKSYGKLGRNTFNGNGLGISLVSDATNSSGGPGGGGIFGKGGTGGQYPGTVNGGNGSGYGAGGGGGSLNGNGGNGSSGILIIEY